MAKGDYRCCDVCDSKVFYDSNLNYEFTKEPGVRGMHYTLDYLGDWCVLCTDCAKTHEVVIRPRAVQETNSVQQIHQERG